MAVTPARLRALEILRQVGRGRRLDLAFAQVAGPLPPRERRWVHELVYGVSRLRGRLDHLLAPHVHKGLARLDVRVHEVLRAAAYQLLYMRSVPAYAAVSQAVEQARSAAGPGAGALANAVLRRVGEAGEAPELFPSPERDPLGFLATWGSHPRWLLERWLARWPFPEVRALVELDNRNPPVSLVPLELDPGDAVAALARAGLDAREVGRGSGAVELAPGTSPAAALEVVRAVVQDPGAALVVVYADPRPGSCVADLCAAPGGKALALTRRADYVLAADRSLARVQALRENVARTGRRAGVVVADAVAPPLRSAGLVLVDAPCTGTGTLRRHPDARWRLAPEDIPKLASVQARLLDGAATVVPAGGVLVYSTCTLEPEENEEQVERFLARHRGFRLAPSAAVPGELLGEGLLRVLPQQTGFDGAFAARMARLG